MNTVETSRTNSPITGNPGLTGADLRIDSADPGLPSDTYAPGIDMPFADQYNLGRNRFRFVSEARTQPTPQERDQEWRRSILPEHARWHELQQLGLTSNRDFFEYHRGLLQRFNEQRQRNGLPALQPWHPGTITLPDGQQLAPPNPRDYPNFNDFSAAMIRYHNAADNSTAGSDQDISDPATAPMHDRFYQFHAWVDQQYQAWINLHGQPPAR